MSLLTRDPLYLGLIGLVEAVCQISTALFGGYLADRTGPTRIVVGGFAVSLICSLLLWHLPQSGSIPAHLFVVVGLSGLARGFLGPAMFSLHDLSAAWCAIPENAATWNSANWQFAATAGPALGGVLIGLIGPAWTYAINLLRSGILGILFPGGQHIPGPADRAGRKSRVAVPGAHRRSAIGLHRQAMLAAMALDMFAVLFGGVVAVLPVFAVEILHAGPEALGLMRAAPAAGAALMALIIAFFPARPSRGPRLALRRSRIRNVPVTAFGFSRDLIVSTAILALAGGLDNISVVIRSTILQTVRTAGNARPRLCGLGVFIGSRTRLVRLNQALRRGFWVL